MVGKNTARREKDKRAEAPPAAPVHLPLPGGAPKLDKLIHERLRLGILSALSVNPISPLVDEKDDHERGGHDPQPCLATSLAPTRLVDVGHRLLCT